VLYSPEAFSGTHFYYRLYKSIVRLKIRWNKIFNDLIGTRTRGLPSCSILPQPYMLPCSRFPLSIALWQQIQWSLVSLMFNEQSQTCTLWEIICKNSSRIPPIRLSTQVTSRPAFATQAVTGIVHLDMRQEWLFVNLLTHFPPELLLASLFTAFSIFLIRLPLDIRWIGASILWLNMPRNWSSPP
jgi:hypothetical protein